MATIALYANKVGRMPGLIGEVKKSIEDFKSGLLNFKTGMLKIDKGVCNLEDVADMVQASTRTQEEKAASIEKARQNTEQFVTDVVRIDTDVADIVRERKDDFYRRYNYLKPSSEKNGWEKFCDGCEKAWKWCKEHWVMVVTILVVVAIAVMAVVTFGMAVAAVAAIAGIISLVLCVADTICMIATGGKDLASVFREKGWNVLADIFQGLQIGCDIVSILLPAGAAFKAMSKIGVKNFAKLSLKTLKKAFKETVDTLWKKGFKKSFRDGIKNFCKLTFKTFVFDIDDFTQVRDGKRVWKLMGDKLDLVAPNKNWIVGEGELKPSLDVVSGSKNSEGFTMAEIMGQEKFSMFPDTIPYKDGIPDLAGFAVAEAPNSMKKFNIDSFLDGGFEAKKFTNELRRMNMSNADVGLAANRGITVADLENYFGFKLTWHEDVGMKKCFLVPTEIHARVGHVGAVANFKFTFRKALDISGLAGNKVAQYGFRFAVDWGVKMAFEN